MTQTDISKPLITVVGAASKQGRSVADALLDSGRYRVRALTRRRDSQPAQALAQKGAEVVVAPLELGRQAELTAAMQGSAGAFLMTPPIVKVPPAETELTLGQESADAAVAAGVEHVVFSGLENVEARTGGTKWAPHFTDKAKVEDYIRSLPVRSSFVYLAFYYTNFLEFYAPQRGEDGMTFAIYLPPDIVKTRYPCQTTRPKRAAAGTSSAPPVPARGWETCCAAIGGPSPGRARWTTPPPRRSGSCARTWCSTRI